MATSSQSPCLAALIVAAALLLPAGGTRAQTVTVDDFEAGVFTSQTGIDLPYRLFVPDGADHGPLPLVVFLHGVGESGTDNRSQLTGQTAPLVFVQPVNQAAFPAYMLAPQAPVTDQWVNVPFAGGSYDLASTPLSPSLGAAIDLLDWLQTQHAIDADRVYVTGLSMGGYGTWDAILREPDRFAAAVPIAGAGDPSLGGGIADLPVWAFHSADDPVVPVSGSREMVAAMAVAGGSPLYTEYQSAGHFSWVPAYATPELLPWMYAQRRAAPVPEPGPVITFLAVACSAALRRRRAPLTLRHRP